MSVAELAARLPSIDVLKQWSRAIATLDVIMSPDWEYRYFSFDPRWSESEQMASMRNGSGDEYAIVFTEDGAFVRGFDHESSLSPSMQSPPGVAPGVVDGLPEVFAPQVLEPAFSLHDVPAITVCLWRRNDDDRWSHGSPTDPPVADDDGGASWLFEDLDGNPETYVRFVADYYETEVDIADVSLVFDGLPIDADLITRLNPEADPAVALAEIAELRRP